jgi:hypothetical protein
MQTKKEKRTVMTGKRSFRGPYKVNKSHRAQPRRYYNYSAASPFQERENKVVAARFQNRTGPKTVTPIAMARQQETSRMVQEPRNFQPRCRATSAANRDGRTRSAGTRCSCVQGSRRLERPGCSGGQVGGVCWRRIEVEFERG